jgi:GNAT superfamily N-acetyltransferase
MSPHSQSADDMNFTVVKSHPSLLRYVESLQAKNSNALGFLPRTVFEREAQLGRMFLGLLNGEPCGYILAGSGWQGVLRRWQVCIQYDARRRLYGAMLVAAVEQYGESLGCTQSIVRCASDLDANAFWAGVGYQFAGSKPGGVSRRSRRPCINVWLKALSPNWIATSWKNGRPRIYASDADRLRAWRERKRNSAVETKQRRQAPRFPGRTQFVLAKSVEKVT